MVTFRGSGVGGCIREIVSSVLNPESTKPPPSKRLFLSDGHLHQSGVTSFLVDNGVKIPSHHYLPKELEGTYKTESFTITGHVDGVVEGVGSGGLSILEVKAITRDKFKSLKKAQTWEEVYPQYVPQIQTYMSFPNLHLIDLNYPTPKETRLVFKNRDTSEILQGIGIIPHTTYREDMVVQHSPQIFSRVLERLDQACYYIQNNHIPDNCDLSGYCFFCKKAPRNRKRTTKRKVQLKERDKYLEKWLEEWKEGTTLVKKNRKKILSRFDKYNADILEIKKGMRPIKRETYE